MSSNIQSSVSSNSNRSTNCHRPSTTNAIATAEAIGPHHDQMDLITATTNSMVSALPTKMAITVEPPIADSVSAAVEIASLQILKANHHSQNVDSKGKDGEKLPTDASTEITAAATVVNADSTDSIGKVKPEPTDDEDKQDQQTLTRKKPNDLLNRTTTTTTDSTHNPVQRLIQTLQNEKEHLQKQCSIYETNHTQISIQNVQLKSAIHDYQHTIKSLQEQNVSLMNQRNNLINQSRYAMWNWCVHVEKLKEDQFRCGLLWQNFNGLHQVLEARNTTKSTNDTSFGVVNTVDENSYTTITSGVQDENSLEMKQNTTKKKTTEDKSITNADPPSNDNIIHRHFLQPKAEATYKDSVHPTDDKATEDKKDNEILASNSAAVFTTKPSVKVSPKPKTSLTLGEATTPNVTVASQFNTPSVMNPLPIPGVTPGVTPPPPMRDHPNNNQTIVNGNPLFLKPPSHNNYYHVSPYSSSYHAISSYPGQPPQHQAMPMSHYGFYPTTYTNQNNDIQACVGPSSLSSPSHFTVVHKEEKEKRPLSSPKTSIIQGNQCKEVGKVNDKCKGQKKRKVSTKSNHDRPSNSVVKKGKKKKITMTM